MQNLIIRVATEDDAPILASLIEEFVKGHPAENHHRPLNTMREAYFGSINSTYIDLAIRNDEIIGFCGWKKTYDMFWAMFGGEVIGIYVKPKYRGQGIAAILVAKICAQIRDSGGVFLRAQYGDEMAKFYERVAIGMPQRECNLSASAFRAVADLDGCSARDIVRSLPNKALNYEEQKTG